MQPFLAMIIPVNQGAHPEHPIAPGGPPPTIWPSPGHPTHPIFYPPGIWGGGNQPFPTPPIHIPPAGGPPGIWGPPGPWPTPPIVMPIPPDRPPGTWGGSGEPFPTPPIELPGDEGGGKPPQQIIEWKTAWSPQTGWVVVGIPTIPHPAPSSSEPAEDEPAAV